LLAAENSPLRESRSLSATLYKMAQMLRIKTDRRRARAAKPTSCQLRKSKESLRHFSEGSAKVPFRASSWEKVLLLIQVQFGYVSVSGRRGFPDLEWFNGYWPTDIQRPQGADVQLKTSTLPKPLGQSCCGAGRGAGAPPRNDMRQASTAGQSTALRASFQTAAPYVLVAIA
jgi:hypothetical protein